MTAHDIVLYGATGFAGQLVAKYLARHPLGSVLRERLEAAEGGEFMQFGVLAET